MLEMAQEMLKLIHDRFRATLRVMAQLAESVGVPSTVTTLFAGRERTECCAESSRHQTEPCWESRAASPVPASSASGASESGDNGQGSTAASAQPAAPHLVSAAEVRPLRTDDAIGGSTYLARIIWSLGVSELEGTGPLRPADMARMIMSRSPVSLEPPNVARYIRRSKPTCIEVAHTEGSSSFYKLNDEGRALFAELFRAKK
jgi:hypothetical protein